MWLLDCGFGSLEGGVLLLLLTLILRRRSRGEGGGNSLLRRKIRRRGERVCWSVSVSAIENVDGNGWLGWGC